MCADLMKNDDDVLRWYLLGELDDDVAGTVEQRLLDDNDFFELAEAVEGDLLAAVAQGELSPAERERIIRRLARTRTGHARLALAQALTSFGKVTTVTHAMRTVATPLPFRRPEPARRRLAVRFAALAAGLAAAAFTGWLAFQVVPPEGSGAAINRVPVPGTSGTAPRTAQAPAVPRKPAGHPATPGMPSAAPDRTAQAESAAPPAAPRPAAVVLQLAFTNLRSGDQPDAEPLRIPAGAQQVELHMPVDEAETFRSYEVSVQDTATAEEVWSGRAPSRKLDGETAVVVSLPAAKLPHGTYQVDLHGIGKDPEPEFVGSTTFNVQTP
jgi:hypothetical protein